MTVEEELAVRLVGVAPARRAAAERIYELMEAADVDTLLALLKSQRLLGLGGSRMIQTYPELVQPPIRIAVEASLTDAGHRHTLNAHWTRRFCRRLSDASITAVPLKGALLAERLYSDPAVRSPAGDIDLLIGPEQLDSAVELFEDLGYVPRRSTIWGDGLPHYHHALAPVDPSLPRVELHWRIHWYEKEFAGALIRRSSPDELGTLIPSLADDLASLLIIFARDGFVDLRMAADIGAWWDAHGDELGRPALEQVIAENPRLRSALLAAVDVAHDLVRLPLGELVSDRWGRSRRAMAATRLLNWRQQGPLEEWRTKVTLIDLLLTPLAAMPVFVRHYWLQPLPKYVSDYGWQPRARLRNQLLRLVHALGRMVRSTWRFGRLLWSIRQGRRCDALPSPLE